MQTIVNTKQKTADTKTAAFEGVEKDREQVSGSVAVLEAFLAEGVTTVFGYPGGRYHAHLRCAL